MIYAERELFAGGGHLLFQLRKKVLGFTERMFRGSERRLGFTKRRFGFTKRLLGFTKRLLGFTRRKILSQQGNIENHGASVFIIG